MNPKLREYLTQVYRFRLRADFLAEFRFGEFGFAVLFRFLAVAERLARFARATIFLEGPPIDERAAWAVAVRAADCTFFAIGEPVLKSVS